MINPSVKTSFSTHEVVVLSRFTKFMLDYLAREGIFEPSEPHVEGRRKGVRRQYSYSDVVLLRALYAVCAGRGKIRHLKGALVAFRKEFGQITPNHKIAKHLIVQGDELCVTNGQGMVRQLRDGQFILSLVVDLEEAHEAVASQIFYQPETGYRLTEAAAAQAETERHKVWLPIKERRLAKAVGF